MKINNNKEVIGNIPTNLNKMDRTLDEIKNDLDKIYIDLILSQQHTIALCNQITENYKKNNQSKKENKTPIINLQINYIFPTTGEIK